MHVCPRYNSFVPVQRAASRQIATRETCDCTTHHTRYVLCALTAEACSEYVRAAVALQVVRFTRDVAGHGAIVYAQAVETPVAVVYVVPGLSCCARSAD